MCPPSRPSGAGPKDAHAETTEELGKSPTPAKTADLSTKTKRLYTRKEVAESDDWLFIIENQVYKVPEVWATNSHPGGEILLRDARGADITVVAKQTLGGWLFGGVGSLLNCNNSGRRTALN